MTGHALMRESFIISASAGLVSSRTCSTSVCFRASTTPLPNSKGPGSSPTFWRVKASEAEKEVKTDCNCPWPIAQAMAMEIGGGGGMLVAEPAARIKAETDLEFYRRKQNVVAVRHVSGDQLVAIVEIVSRGNKSYESAESVRAFIEPIATGDSLVDMPLYLRPGRYVSVPLEETYRLAFESVPRRWRTILEPR